MSPSRPRPTAPRPPPPKSRKPRASRLAELPLEIPQVLDAAAVA